MTTKFKPNPKTDAARADSLERLVMRLRQRIQKLEDENAKLGYWAETHWRWASGHCAERMADYEQHCKELRRLFKMRDYNPKRYRAFINRETKRMVAGWRKPKAHNKQAEPRPGE